MVVFITLVASFALLVTSHVALAFLLTLRRPRWRGPVALLVAPLAPFWGYSAKLYAWSAAWLLGFVLYAAAQLLAVV